MIAAIDITGDGEIFLPDFVRIMLAQPDIDYTAADIHQSFLLLAGDEHPPGFIPCDLLEQQLMFLPGAKFSKDKCDEILCLAKVDANGLVDYAEFVNLMMGLEHGENTEDSAV